VSTDFDGTIDEYFTSSVVDNAAIADAVWDESLSAHQTAGTAGRALTIAGVILSETTVAGSPTTSSIELTAGSAVNDFYVDQTLVIVSGSGLGQARIISTYNGTTKIATFDEAFIVAPSVSDAIIIRADHVHPVSQIADAVWDEATAGHAVGGSFGEQLGTNLTEHNQTQSDIGALQDISIADVQTALTNQGYTAARAILLDFLDAAISTLHTSAQETTNQAALIAEHDATQATLATMETKAQADARQAILVAEHDATQADIAALSIPTANDIADQVWDEALAGHVAAGSTGEALNNAGSGASAADIADAVWDEAKAGHVAAGSFGLELGTNQAEHDATQATLATQETKAQADTRQAILVAEHDATQADIAALNDLTATQVENAVWDATQASHVAAGSTGESLNNAGSGASASAIADAVWDEAKAGHVAAGSFGLELGTNQAEHDQTQADIAALNDLDATAVENAVWDASQASHLGAGTTGESLDDAGAAAATPAAIADAVWDEAASGHVAAGSMGELQANADVLTSSRQSEADAATRASTNQTEHDQTQTDIANIPAAPSAGVIADAVWDESLAAHTGVGSMGENQNIIDDLELKSEADIRQAALIAEHNATQVDISNIAAAPTVADIVDGVWDEPIAGHTTAGTTGKALDDAGGVGASPSDIADAVWDEVASGHNTAGTMGELQNNLLSVGTTAIVVGGMTAEMSDETVAIDATIDGDSDIIAEVGD